MKYLPSTYDVYYALGNSFYRMEQYGQAEKYYQMANYMIPSRLKPIYSLWKLYVEKGDSLRGIQMAGLALKQPIRVENTFTIKAKKEMSSYLIAHQ